MPDSRKRLYTSVRQVFEALEKNQRLVHVGNAGVRHFWGKVEKQAAAVGPRVYWLPRKIELVPPKMTAYPAVLPGPNGANRQVHLYAKNDKKTLVEIWLYTEQGRPDVDIEDLFDLYSLALADVLLVESEYAFEANWAEQDALSIATDCMRAALTLRIPLIEQQPVAPMADDNVALRDT